MSIKERLQAIESVADLTAVLEDIAGTNWSTDQILFYLPTRFHRAAREFWESDGEATDNISTPAVPLDAAIDGILERLVVRSADSNAHADPHGNPKSRGDESERCTIPEDIEPSSMLWYLLSAIKAEIAAVEKTAPKRYKLTNGRCVGAEGESFTYQFTWSSEPDKYLPGEYRRGKDRIGARVGEQGSQDKTYELALEDYVGAKVDAAAFVVDPSFLLRTLFERLIAARDVIDWDRIEALENPDALGAATRPIAVEKLNRGQAEAVANAAGRTISYVWGPPGTGKTTTLAALVEHLSAIGKRVLVLSPYNVAVDQAALATFKRMQPPIGRIVRFGRRTKPTRRAKLDMETLLEDHAKASGLLTAAQQLHHSAFGAAGKSASRTGDTFKSCIEDLGWLVMQLHEEGDDLAQLKSAVKALREQFKAPEGKILGEARIVCSTVALWMLSPLMQKQVFDYVIVDESSVLRRPEAVLIAGTSRSPISFFGDPKQLPAIVQSSDPMCEEWLGLNPFALATVDALNAPASCTMLDVQYRMAPSIRAIVSELFYSDRLVDGVVPPDGRVILVDTSNTSATATTRWIKMSPSKENMIHRNVVASLLGKLKAAGKTEVLVLSPFVAQKRAYEREPITNRFSEARFGTIHASQGGESDVVILDLVAAPGRGKSRFLNDHKNPTFPNLINVALSRAKHTLIVVAHRKHVRDSYDGTLMKVVIDRVGREDTRSVSADLRVNL